MAETLNCSKIAVIQGGNIIVKSAEADVTELATYGDIYPLEEILRLKNDLAEAEVRFGLDIKTETLGTTQDLKSLTNEARKLISPIRTLVEIKFAGSTEELNLFLDSIGFYNSFPKNKKETVETFVTISQNLPIQKSKLTALGANETILDRIQTISTDYLTATTNQGVSRNKTTRLTAEGTQELIALQARIINLCKYARAVFKDSPEKQRQYNFSLLATSFAKTRRKKADVSTNENSEAA